MKRIMVVGAPGTGKTTFARVLHAKTGLPVIHLDTLYFDPVILYAKHPEVWADQVEALAQSDEWIIEGCHVVNFSEQAHRADAIIFLDYARHVILWRLVKRTISQRNKASPEMPDGWQEANDTHPARWLFKVTLNFGHTFKPDLAKLLRPVKGQQRLIFKNSKQAAEYLKRVR